MVTISQFGNVPTGLHPNAESTLRIVNEIFAAFPNRFRFTSGYRTPQQNAAANGVANSLHVKALAADFVPVDGKYPAGEFQKISAIVARHGGELIKHNVGSGLHYHIEPKGGGWAIAAAGGISAVAIVGLLVLVLLLTD